MKFKRYLSVFLMISVLALSAAGCAKEPVKDTTWMSQAATEVAPKIDAKSIGKVYLEGKVYSFPIKPSELTANGWTYASAQVADEKVQAHGWYGKYVEFRHGENTKITAALFNDSDSEAAVRDSLIGDITLTADNGNVMIAGGVFPGMELSSLDAVSDRIKFTEENGIFTAKFTDENGYSCTANIEISGEPKALRSINYNCKFATSVEDIVNACLNTVTQSDPSFVGSVDRKNDPNVYLESSRKYLAENLVYCLGFEIKDLDNATYDKVYALMDKIYAKSEWSTTETEKAFIVIYNAPDNLTDIAAAAIQETADEYQGKVSKATTDPEFLKDFLDRLIKSSDKFEYSSGNQYIVNTEDINSSITEVLLCLLGCHNMI